MRLTRTRSSVRTWVETYIWAFLNGEIFFFGISQLKTRKIFPVISNLCVRAISDTFKQIGPSPYYLCFCVRVRVRVNCLIPVASMSLLLARFGKGAACEEPKRGRGRFCICWNTTYFLKSLSVFENILWFFSYSLGLFFVVRVRILRLGLDLWFAICRFCEN